MLPAISANLPAYLVPPNPNGPTSETQESSRFGPAATVELSASGSAVAENAAPGAGLYGPNGQFVEAGARRNTANQHSEKNPPTPTEGRTDQQPDSAPTASQQRPADEEQETAANRNVQNESRSRRDAPRPPESTELAPPSEHEVRDLSIKEVDAVIPPAAREELRELADRIEKKSESQRLNAREYREIAQFFERVGRHDEARRARELATDLEKQRLMSQEESNAPSSIDDLVAA